MNLVCREHHTPVNAKGKGCKPCAAELRRYKARRRARREAARELRS